MVVSYTSAGFIEKSGMGLVIELTEGTWYLPSPDVPVLLSGQPMLVINSNGEEEGCAWLSPVCEVRKKDLVVNLRGHIYCTGWREVQRILSGSIHRAKVIEFHVPENCRAKLSPFLPVS